jgi:hypothetical protein
LLLTHARTDSQHQGENNRQPATLTYHDWPPRGQVSNGYPATEAGGVSSGTPAFPNSLNDSRAEGNHVCGENGREP